MTELFQNRDSKIHNHATASPFVIEFGVSKADWTNRVNQFPNSDSSEEMDKIEQIFRAKIAGKGDEELRSILWHWEKAFKPQKRSKKPPQRWNTFY